MDKSKILQYLKNNQKILQLDLTDVNVLTEQIDVWLEECIFDLKFAILFSPYESANITQDEADLFWSIIKIKLKESIDPSFFAESLINDYKKIKLSSSLLKLK